MWYSDMHLICEMDNLQFLLKKKKKRRSYLKFDTQWHNAKTFIQEPRNTLQMFDDQSGPIPHHKPFWTQHRDFTAKERLP